MPLRAVRMLLCGCTTAAVAAGVAGELVMPDRCQFLVLDADASAEQVQRFLGFEMPILFRTPVRLNIKRYN